jgi:hypothetical protein
MSKDSAAAAEPSVAPVVVAPVGPEPPSTSSFRNRLGAGLVAGLMLALGALFFKEIPEKNESLITYMLGQLSGFAAAVVAYHYTMNATNTAASANTGKALDAIAEAQKRANGSAAG